MNSPDLILFWIAFFAYLAGFLLYSLFLAMKKDLFAKLGLYSMIAGFIPQSAGFIVRWLLSDHVPLSNMYEYMALMSWMAVLSLFVIIGKYKRPVFGGFISPVVFMLMVTASMLPKDISQALMPALQSYWLTIHVTLAALGSGSFAVACAVSFVYLLKKGSESSGKVFSDKQEILPAIWGGLVFPPVFAILGKLSGLTPDSTELLLNLGGEGAEGWGWFFAGSGLGFPLGMILWTVVHHQYESKSQRKHGVGIFTIAVIAILISGLITGLAVKNDIIVLTEKSAWKIFEFFGALWIVSLIIFIPVLKLIGDKGFEFFRKANINADLLDEINYKTVSLGYPLYTVGALFAGAIWAEQAWGTFWGWDPKEVGALIIWLFYSGFLHARRQHNWRGNKAAILSVLGLLMILLSFFGNYFFGGQHAYT